MQRKKLGTALVWMVCLLGMVAVVWSRPPMGGSGKKEYPPLALAAPVAEPEPQADSQTPPVTELPPAEEAVAAMAPVGELQSHPMITEPRTLTGGVWVREIAPFKMTIELQDHELRATVEGLIEADVKFEGQFSAEYHTTRDSILYGVITSGKFTVPSDDPEVRLEADAIAPLFFDQPFSFRYRVDEDALTVKDFKMGQLPSGYEDVQELLNLVAGRFHNAPTPLKP